MTDSFQEFIGYLNSLENLDKLNDFLFSIFNTNSDTKYNNTNPSLTEEFITLLNGLIPILSNEPEKCKEKIAKTLKKMKINNSNFDNNMLSEILYKFIEDFKKKKFEENLIQMNWQVSVVERKNDSTNLSKSDKVEITTKYNCFDANEQKYKTHIVKMNYNEFSEILNNFKKIDEQLHMFKG